MRKSKINSKIIKSIANKNNARRIANNEGVSFRNKENILEKIELFKKNEKLVFDFLEGREATISNEVKDAAKTYFLFKLKNSPSPLRHKSIRDESIKENYELYKKYLEKLS